jgi:DNA polymerase-3 subunit beta
MNVTVKQQLLAHGLALVARAVAPRSTLPVLSNILVKTDEGRLRLSATNLELGITTWIGAKVKTEGAITIPARTFSDLISNLPSEDVLLSLDGLTRTLNVKCGGSNTDIKGIDAEEFPPIPEPDMSNGIPLNVENFKEMIQQVAFAASTDDSRPTLTGVNLTADGNKLTMAATDGFRISVRTALLAEPLARRFDAIIPARAMTELSRIATDGDETLLMSFPAERGQVIFHMKDVELVSQLIDGNFPDYKAIIPPSFKTHTILSTPGLLAACKQAEIIARDSTNVARLDIQPETEGEKSATLEISAVSEQTGSSEILVDASIEGTPLLVAFNVRFLREALEVIKTPNVILETNAANSPGMIRPVGDEFFKHIIMPMHLG